MGPPRWLTTLVFAFAFPMLLLVVIAIPLMLESFYKETLRMWTLHPYGTGAFFASIVAGAAYGYFGQSYVHKHAAAE